MSDLDEAVKRLNDWLGSKVGDMPIYPADIRTVLDALSEAQADVDDLTAWRDSALTLMAGLEAVIERAKAAGSQSEWDIPPTVKHILNTAPVDALRERDAEKWDEGYEAGAEDQAECEGHRYRDDSETRALGFHHWTRNPYRKEQP